MNIAEIGITETLSDARKNKIRLSNTFSVIASIIFLINGITNIRIQDTFSGVLLISFAVFCLFTILFNYLNLNKVALSYLFSIISFGIFYFDSYSGVESGTYMYYFPLLLGIANVFDVRTKKDRLILTIQVGILLILATTNVQTNHQLFINYDLSTEQKKEMFRYNICFSLFSMFYFIYLIMKNNISQLTLLENLINEKSKGLNLEQEKNKEKEILLAELQHRLKNNLSIVSSIIKLKAELPHNQNMENFQAECLHAIHSIGLAYHLQTYSNGGMYVPIDLYTKKISELEILHEKYPGVTIQGTNLNMHIKQAVPFGLLLHECLAQFCRLSNCSPDKSLSIECSNSELTLNISIKSSLPALFDDENRNDLLQGFIEQLDATITPLDKFHYKITIPQDENLYEIESSKLFN